MLKVQNHDEKIAAIVNQNRVGKETKFTTKDDGFLYYRDRVSVPNDDELKKSFLEEAHSGSFSMHRGSTKMFQDLKTSYWWSRIKRDVLEFFWWSRIKRDVLEFVTKCMVCQKVKAEHQVPSGLLQPIKIPEWK